MIPMYESGSYFVKDAQTMTAIIDGAMSFDDATKSGLVADKLEPSKLSQFKYVCYKYGIDILSAIETREFKNKLNSNIKAVLMSLNDTFTPNSLDNQNTLELESKDKILNIGENLFKIILDIEKNFREKHGDTENALIQFYTKHQETAFVMDLGTEFFRKCLTMYVNHQFNSATVLDFTVLNVELCGVIKELIVKHACNMEENGFEILTFNKIDWDK